MTKTVILFGGSFDPIHVGHVAVAAASCKKLCADEVVFVPAKRSPHKLDNPTTSADHRLKMVSIAIEDTPCFTVSDCEINRPQPSYTFDTLKHFRQLLGSETQICFLIGADTIDDLPKWHRIEELMTLCRFCTMYRGGRELPNFDQFRGVFSDDRIAQLQEDIIETPLLDISSTDIRTKLAAGQSVDDMLSPNVINYIKQNRLYQPKI
jgi:nicotinate-nucleotide adenylyltransferase